MSAATAYLLGCASVSLILVCAWWHHRPACDDQELTTTGFLADCFLEECEDLDRIAASYESARNERHADV